jgi:hypothetical protein
LERFFSQNVFTQEIKKQWHLYLVPYSFSWRFPVQFRLCTACTFLLSKQIHFMCIPFVTLYIYIKFYLENVFFSFENPSEFLVIHL